MDENLGSEKWLFVFGGIPSGNWTWLWKFTIFNGCVAHEGFPCLSSQPCFFTRDICQRRLCHMVWMNFIVMKHTFLLKNVMDRMGMIQNIWNLETGEIFSHIKHSWPWQKTKVTLMLWVVVIFIPSCRSGVHSRSFAIFWYQMLSSFTSVNPCFPKVHDPKLFRSPDVFCPSHFSRFFSQKSDAKTWEISTVPTLFLPVESSHQEVPKIEGEGKDRRSCQVLAKTNEL